MAVLVAVWKRGVAVFVTVQWGCSFRDRRCHRPRRGRWGCGGGPGGSLCTVECSSGCGVSQVAVRVAVFVAVLVAILEKWGCGVAVRVAVAVQVTVGVDVLVAVQVGVAVLDRWRCSARHRRVGLSFRIDFEDFTGLDGVPMLAIPNNTGASLTSRRALAVVGIWNVQHRLRPGGLSWSRTQLKAVPQPMTRTWSTQFPLGPPLAVVP